MNQATLSGPIKKSIKVKQIRVASSARTVVDVKVEGDKVKKVKAKKDILVMILKTISSLVVAI